ncbi:helix-turn-helix domain-containing protein [Mycolicibacterium sp.]|uniref:helix-turn-helix domain-containing protein n=1 Tax=Mycolicibacterium sp. TaxID=2320850 RepID=UPI003D0C19D5
MERTSTSRPGHFLIDADDLDEIEEQIGTEFGRIRIDRSVSGSSTRTRVWRTSVGGLDVDDAEYTYSMSYEMAAPQNILLCRMHSGVLEESQPGRDSRAYGTGSVVAFGALADGPVRGRVLRARYHIVNVPRRALVASACDDPDAVVQLADTAPVSEEANRHLVEVIDHIRHSLMGSPFAAQDPLIAEGIRQYLVATMLAAFPYTCSDGPHGARDEDNHDALRRAVAFIDDNACTAITPADIATAARVPTRVLEVMFQRQRGHSLAHYLRKVRLSCAHRDLAASSPVTGSVAAVARRWGFWNLRRFDAMYRRAYGAAPEATLKS